MNSRSTNYAALETNAARAIKNAHLKKWFTLGALAIFGVIVISTVVIQNRKLATEKAVASEYLTIEDKVKKLSESYMELLRAQYAKGASASAADIPEPDLLPAAQEYVTFYKKYPDQPLGWLAALQAANIFVEKKNWTQAKELLEPIVPKSLKHALLQVKMRRTLAGVYAQEGDYKKAIAELEYVRNVKDGLVDPDEVDLVKAQFLYLSGSKQEAADLLNKLAQTMPSVTDMQNFSQNSVRKEAMMWKNYWNL